MGDGGKTVDAKDQSFKKFRGVSCDPYFDFLKFSHPQLFLNDDKLVVAANIARGTVVRSEISKIFLPILLILAKKNLMILMKNWLRVK